MRRSRIAAYACMLLIGLARPATAGILDGLAAYFPLDGDATDQSGNGNDGQVIGATPTSDRFGYSASAYHFNGVEDYVRTPDSPSLNITGDLTISAWIRTPGADFGRIIFSNMLEVSPHDGYSLRTSNDGSLQYMAGDQVLLGQTLVTSDTWTHVAVVQSGTEATIYVNGLLDIAGTVGVPTSSGVDQTIGASFSPFYFWNGDLDEVRVYGRALSAVEVQQLYAIPEPSAVVLAALGAGICLVVSGRRRAS